MRDSRVISFLLLLLLFSHWVVANFLWPPWTASHQASLCSVSPRVCSNSCPLNRWCHPTISSSVISFSSCPQSFPARLSFLMNLPIWWPSIRASASVLSMNIQGWFPLRLTGLISWPSKGILKASGTTFQRYHSLVLILLYGPSFTSIHDYWNIQ